MICACQVVICVWPPFGPRQLTTYKTMLGNKSHVTSASLDVMPTNSADKNADNELRSKTTARYFISIQVLYSLPRFRT